MIIAAKRVTIVFVCTDCKKTEDWPVTSLDSGTPICPGCDKDMKVGDFVSTDRYRSPTVMDIHRCESHDHVAVCMNGELVISNDYGVENVIRLCKHLGMKVNSVTHSREEFEKKFA